ncbi:MAG: YaaA family protein, partial [Gammaproteobacteria bacterium]|nr:YaaA family protein [Gammaproteobacteria bacterium]
MLVILSPAKSQNFVDRLPDVKSSQPQAKSDTKILVNELKKLNKAKIKTLMSVSDKIAILNFER